MFYRDFIEKKDPTICEELNTYMKYDQISNFYEEYDKMIIESIKSKNDKDTMEEENKIETKDVINKETETEKTENLINTNYASNTDERFENSGSDSSKNTEKGNIIKIKNDINNEYVNIETFNSAIKLLTQQIEELKEKSSRDKKELIEKNEKLEAKVNEMSNDISNLNEKLDLLLLINNLVCQRDTYKKALEELIKFIAEKYSINIDEINTNDPIWKKTKSICLLLNKLDVKEKDNCQKVISGLKSLLFCKDYCNCIVHPKGPFAKQLKSYYERTNFMPILSNACFKSMKEISEKFFGTVVNSIGDFQIINLVLLDKIKTWNDTEDFNYNEYFEKESLNVGNIMNDFKIAIDLIEQNKINDKIDNSLDN